MPKKARAETRVQSFMCTNPKCRRTSANPIIVQNLSSSDEVSYDACPYCLTEIVIGETVKPKDDEEEEKSESKEESETEGSEEEYTRLRQPLQPPEGPDECLYHFGYLSERSREEEIPEVCMTCEKLVQCMFKKVV